MISFTDIRELDCLLHMAWIKHNFYNLVTPIGKLGQIVATASIDHKTSLDELYT